jgi:hypothetical protein
MDSSRRKKSCRQCAKAKRKCSQGMPCQRCLRQGLQCTYTNQLVPTKSRDEQRYSAAENHDFSLESPVVALFSESLNTHDDLPCVANTDLGAAYAPDFALLSARSSLWSPKLSSASWISPTQLSRIQYPCNVLMNAPMAFANEIGTPWSHALLWVEDEMPKCLRGKALACAGQADCSYPSRCSCRLCPIWTEK